MNKHLQVDAQDLAAPYVYWLTAEVWYNLQAPYDNSTKCQMGRIKLINYTMNAWLTPKNASVSEKFSNDFFFIIIFFFNLLFIKLKGK